MNKRVLVVDDEEHIREVALVALEEVGGWEVLTASSGYEALAMVHQTRPDAILLDVMMPDLDGSDTYSKLQAEESTRSIPVILLTAKVQPADRRRFASLGVAGIISKPFDPLTLAGQVSEMLGWAAA
ncbi:MAG: response regulator [Actinomycetota bacterium]